MSLKDLEKRLSLLQLRADALLYHLPGQHPQKRHGRRKGQKDTLESVVSNLPNKQKKLLERIAKEDPERMQFLEKIFRLDPTYLAKVPAEPGATRKKANISKYSNSELADKAKEGGLKLFGNELSIDPKNWLTKNIFTQNVYDLADELAANVEYDSHPDFPPGLFGTWDYVFMPSGKKKPVDIADEGILENLPRIFDVDDNAYFYSGEASAITILTK